MTGSGCTGSTLLGWNEAMSSDDNVLEFPGERAPVPEPEPGDSDAIMAELARQDEALENGHCPDCGGLLDVEHSIQHVSWPAGLRAMRRDEANVLYWNCAECDHRYYPDTPDAVMRLVLDYLASEWFVGQASPEHLERLQRIADALSLPKGEPRT